MNVIRRILLCERTTEISQPNYLTQAENGIIGTKVLAATVAVAAIAASWACNSVTNKWKLFFVSHKIYIYIALALGKWCNGSCTSSWIPFRQQQNAHKLRPNYGLSHPNNFSKTCCKPFSKFQEHNVNFRPVAKCSLYCWYSNTWNFAVCFFSLIFSS